MKRTSVFKIMALVMALICAVSVFASCGETKKSELKITVSELYTKLEAKCGCAEGMINYLPNVPDSVLDATGIEASLYSDGIYAVAGDFVSAETVAFFVATSEENAKTIATRLENKKAEIVSTNKNYNADNYAIANDGVVVTDGVYVYMVISSKKTEIVNTIKENL